MNKKSDILVPVFTPFNTDGSVNYETLKRLVRSVLDKGADGIYAGGSSAECFLLSTEERKKTLEVIAKEADGKTLIAHVGAIGTDLSIELARHAASVGADGLSSVPPFYYRFTPAEVAQYYTDIADAAGLPMIIYNVPALSGVEMTLEQQTALLSDDRICAIKYTATNYYILNRIKNAVPNKPLYSGMDEGFCSALAAGATGAIGTSMNFWPESFLTIKSEFDAGNIAAARAMQMRLNNVVQTIVEAETIPAMKYAAKVLGLDCGEARRPFRSLTDAEKARIEQALKENY